MALTHSMLRRAQDEDADPWAVSNGLLYGLCQSRPGHSHAPDVTAKVLLIGRTYAAALERGRGGAINAAASNDVFYTRDVPRAMRRAKLDAQLDALRSYGALTDDCLDAVLKTHAYLTAVFRELTNKDKRSLASKYLHFHLPALFFIYDTRAVAALRRLTSRERGHAPQYPERDARYTAFVLSALQLRDEITATSGVELTPRQFDRLLLATFAKR